MISPIFIPNENGKLKYPFLIFFPFTEKEALQNFGLRMVECFGLFGNLEIKPPSVAKEC